MEDIQSSDGAKGDNLTSSTDSLTCDSGRAESADDTHDEDTRCSRHSTSSDITLEGVSNSASGSTLECGESESPEKLATEGESNGNIARPDSLSLPKPLQQYERKRDQSDGQKLVSYIGNSGNNISEWRSCRSASTTEEIPIRKDPEFENIEETMLSKSMPQGTIVRKGEMIEFMADDLQEKIRRSSPLTKTGIKSTISQFKICLRQIHFVCKVVKIKTMLLVI